MNILHIFQSGQEKFSVPYINFINKNKKDFKQNHKFAILGKKEYKKNFTHLSIQTLEYKIVDIYKLFRTMNKQDKIIVHGLLLPQIVIILFLQPWLLKRCYWVVWGGDLYYYKFRKKNLKTNLYEFFRRAVIKNIGYLITYCKSEYELAQNWYGAKGNPHYSIFYLSNVYKEYDFSKFQKNDKKLHIQIGNSADPTNNHIEILETLKVYKDHDIEIICPLSYGDRNYRDKIIKKGKNIFGNKFVPLTTFMSLEDYMQILANVDVAIFNHKRQQAMGNITTLIGLGKKVYIRNDITTWEFCKENKLHVYAINNSKADVLKDIPKEVKESNIKNAKKNLSIEKLIDDWGVIFNE